LFLQKEETRGTSKSEPMEEVEVASSQGKKSKTPNAGSGQAHTGRWYFGVPEAQGKKRRCK